MQLASNGYSPARFWWVEVAAAAAAAAPAKFSYIAVLYIVPQLYIIALILAKFENHGVAGIGFGISTYKKCNYYCYYYYYNYNNSSSLTWHHSVHKKNYIYTY